MFVIESGFCASKVYAWVQGQNKFHPSDYLDVHYTMKRKYIQKLVLIERQSIKITMLKPDKYV